MTNALWATALSIGLVIAGTSHAAPSASGETGAQREIRLAAEQFLETLPAEARNTAVEPFESGERTNWSYFPGRRAGLPLGDLDETARRSLDELLATALSHSGKSKVEDVLALERYLFERSGGSRSRDPGRYTIAFFGVPSVEVPWAWRIEGHHLSVQYSSVAEQGLAVTPFFLGANPTEFPDPNGEERRVLGAEEELARELVLSLNEEQRAKALVSTRAPRDILTRGSARFDAFDERGIAAAEMTSAQRELLTRLVSEYVGNAHEEVAADHLERWRETDTRALSFLWAGGVEPDQPHYYRIEGPRLLIEYDNTQAGADHIHCVWRDAEEDFGRDLLRRHYEESPHHQ